MNPTALPPSSSSFRAVRVTVSPGDWRFEATAEAPLLASAEQAGLDLPASCRNGTCRTCISRLLEGRIAYRIEWPGLSAEEKAEGWILPCVAFPEDDGDIVLHQPAARRAGFAT